MTESRPMAGGSHHCNEGKPLSNIPREGGGEQKSLKFN